MTEDATNGEVRRILRQNNNNERLIGKIVAGLDRENEVNEK